MSSLLILHDILLTSRTQLRLASDLLMDTEQLSDCLTKCSVSMKVVLCVGRVRSSQERESSSKDGGSFFFPPFSPRRRHHNVITTSSPRRHADVIMTLAFSNQSFLARCISVHQIFLPPDRQCQQTGRCIEIDGCVIHCNSFFVDSHFGQQRPLIIEAIAPPNQDQDGW